MSVLPQATGTAADLDRIARLAGALPGIGLAEVDASAALQTRQDRKYLVPMELLPGLLESAGDGLRVLEIDGLRTFDYESVYFDTESLQFYRDHLQGRRRRYKVRTRCYRDSGLTFLELKKKGQRGETVKHRVGHDPEQMMDLGSSGRDWVDGFFDGRAIAGTLRPSLVSSYHRTTFVQPDRGLRVTCDIALIFSGRGRTHAVPGGQVLVETKSVSGRSAADRWLPRRGHRDISVSKYCTGIALTTDMRANPWHRLLRTHMGA